MNISVLQTNIFKGKSNMVIQLNNFFNVLVWIRYHLL